MSYDDFIKFGRETSTLASCGAVLGWDQETYMPKGGAEIRAQQLATISGLVHRRMTSNEYKELLEAAEQAVADEEADSPRDANVREVRRRYDLATKIPEELVVEITRTSTLARRAWVDARDSNDFPGFLPWLEKTVELSRKKADCLGYDKHPYDALIDTYEQGETTESITNMFQPLREALVDLLGRILASGGKVDTSLVRAKYPIDAQKRIGRQAAEMIGFDFDRGRIDVTAHPFCSGAGPDDVRLTTRYSENFFNESFFGTLHEAGHGIYEQGMLMEHWGTPMGEAASLGIHESQSRMWENLVGRSRGFWTHFFPTLKDAFPGALGNGDPESFYRAINEVRPSRIRVEADEVTYNLHIFLRFELEQALVNGELKPADMPGVWNETFRDYFQIEVGDDRHGCLQDIHWAMGGIGYFPTYSLGNIYASQMFLAATRDLGDLPEQFARGEFETLKGWLNQQIHKEGGRLQPRRLVEAITGSAPSHEPLMQHLETKYGEIYGL